MQREASQGSGEVATDARRIIQLAFFAFAIMFPGTLSAAVLREFVQEIYTVGPDGAAWFSSVGMFGSIVAAPFVGRACDRQANRRRFIVTGALINAACWAFMPYAPGFGAALGVRVLEGISSVCVIGPFLACAGDGNASDGSAPDPAIVYGWVGMSLMLGAGLGLAAGGLAGTLSPYAPFALAAVCMSVNALLARHLIPGHRPRVHNSEFDSRRDSTAKTAGWLRLRKSHALIVILPLALAFVDRFSVGYLMTSLNFRMREDLAMNAAAAGGVLGIIMILMSLLSPAAAMLVRRGGSGISPPIRAVVLGSVVYGIGLALTGFAATGGEMAGAALLAGLGAGCMHAPTIILTSRLAPPAFRATAMSAYVAAGSLGNLCGPVVSRQLEVLFASRFGPEGFTLLALVFGGLEIVLAFLLVAAVLPGRRPHRSPENERAAAL